MEASIVNVTTPLSPTPGVYEGVSDDPLVNEPVPLCVQLISVPADADAPVPCVEKLKLPGGQNNSSLPALTVGNANDDTEAILVPTGRPLTLNSTSEATLEMDWAVTGDEARTLIPVIVIVFIPVLLASVPSTTPTDTRVAVTLIIATTAFEPVPANETVPELGSNSKAGSDSAKLTVSTEKFLMSKSPFCVSVITIGLSVT